MDHKIMRSIYQYLILVRVCVCGRERERERALVVSVPVRLRRVGKGSRSTVRDMHSLEYSRELLLFFFLSTIYLYAHTNGLERSGVKEVRNGHGIKISIAQ